eukprot:gene19307-25960_t
MLYDTTPEPLSCTCAAPGASPRRRRPTSFLVKQIPGVSEVEAFSFARKSDPEDVMNGYQIGQGQAPLLAVSRYDQRISTVSTTSKSDRRMSTMSVTSKSERRMSSMSITSQQSERRMSIHSASHNLSIMNLPTRQLYAQQGNWTGSPSGAGGGAQGRAFSPPPVSSRSSKILPIEERPETGTPKSASLSCYSHSRPNPGGGLHVEKSALSIQTHNRRRSVLEPKSSKRSVECIGAEISLPCSSVSDMSFKLLPFEKNQPELAVQRSNLSLSCYSPSHPHCEHEGGLRAERSALSIQTHNRRRSVLEPKSSKRSVECIGAEISLPCSSVSDMSFKLLPFEKNQSELAVQRSNLSLSCYSPSHPRREGEGGLRAERSALSIQTHNRRRSNSNQNGSELSFECGGDGIPLNISLPNFSLRSPLGAPLTAEASLPTLWSEASTGTLSKKVGPRGGRKMSCTVESQFAHGLQPPKASKSQRRFSTSSVSFAPSEQLPRASAEQHSQCFIRPH